MKIILYPAWLLVKILIWLVLIGICASAIAVFYGMSKCELPDVHLAPQTPVNISTVAIDPETAQFIKLKSSIRNYSKNPANGYLSFTNWYTAFIDSDYAHFIEKNLPSQYPYFSTISQYWCGYRSIHALLTHAPPFTDQRQVLALFTGLSFSIQYAIKGIYENTLGRLTEKSSQGKQVAEDKTAAKVANDFASFQHENPWYEYPFFKNIKDLWSGIGKEGHNATRNWERKFVLTFEYAVEGSYAWVYKKIIHLFNIPSQNIVTYLWISNAPDSIFNGRFLIHKIQEISNQSYIIAVPSYQSFTEVLLQLAKQGVEFLDIAGNNTILLSATAPQAWTYNLKYGQLLFSMDILSEPSLKRVVVNVPVKSLTGVLNNLVTDGIQIEHLYDY